MRTFLQRLMSAFAELRGGRSAEASELDSLDTSVDHATIESPAPVRRRGLLPRWVPWAAGAVAGLIVIAIVVVLIVTDVPRVRVPDLSGSDRATAIKRMKALGLVLVVRDTRFSADVAAGLVVTQVPKAGAIVRQGATILVDLSAGSESFAMPDVVGQTLDSARQALRDRGLDVVFETATSQSPQGTVLSSIPSAGATITTGDTVRLTVAAGVSATDTLLPSDLSTLTFVLDPAPAPAGATTDVTFDVARRVRALLEAAGARVIVTRAVTDTAATATSVSRLEKAQETSSTALVGLIIASSGTGGLQVQTMATTGAASAAAAANRSLASSLLASLRTNYSTTTTGTLAADTVLQGYGSPAVRIRLGSAISEADKLAFADPTWADNVARDIYRSLASTYGRR